MYTSFIPHALAIVAVQEFPAQQLVSIPLEETYPFVSVQVTAKVLQLGFKGPTPAVPSQQVGQEAGVITMVKFGDV